MACNGSAGNVEILNCILWDGDDEIWTLGNSDQKVIDALLAVLHDGNLLDRRSAVSALGRLGNSSDPKVIDPFLLRQLDSELERLQAIDQAILFGLLDVPTIRKVLAWDDL